MKKNKICIALLVITIGIITAKYNEIHAQTFNTNPSNWMYPDGNINATKYNKIRSYRPQIVDSIKIKWFSNSIKGDVQPLIGNVVHNPPIIANSDEFPFAPLEIVAVIGDTLIILDGSGKTLTHFPLKKSADATNFIIGVSALLDTASTFASPESSSRTLILGFESLEAQTKDSMAVAFLGGWKHSEGNFDFIRKLGLNLRYDHIQYHDYLPNYSASIKPIYARKRFLEDWGVNDYDGYTIFATVDMSQPQLSSQHKDRPYFRGLTAFNLNNANVGYPLAVEPDSYEYRIHLGPQVSFAQPSISNFNWDTTNRILLPCYPTSVGPNNPVTNLTVSNIETYPNESYMFNFTLEKDGILSEYQYGPSVYPLYDEVEKRAKIRSYFIELTDAAKGYPENFILTTTEYNGIGNPVSTGQSGLFLFDNDGIPLYNIWSIHEEQPFYGDRNHFWSVAVGNVDGHSWNNLHPWYPNNPGNEIIVTQSSRDFAFAGSKLMILRYRTGIPTPKASPPNTTLKELDTICTYKIQGWVAAVNDLDGVDGKDEILLVNGSRIVVLRMRDYRSLEFQYGNYFDTVFTHTFPNQTITSAAIADVDGDGRNDIIVTTNEGIYILGTPLERTIDIIDLKLPSNFQTDWCFGDTVKIQWKNIIQGTNFVKILFQETVNNNPTKDSLFVLEENWTNNNDTATYNLIINSFLAGKEGRVIIQSVINPLKNADTTGVLRFHRPTVETDLGSIDTIFVGSEFTISGIATCADSIDLFYSFDLIEWFKVASTTIDSASSYFALTAEIPCMDIFSCSENMTDTTVYGKIIFRRYNSVDSTNIYPLTIKPAALQISIEPCEFACASRTVRWKISDTNIRSGILTVSMSLDTGKTFTRLGIVPIIFGEYIWNVPSNTEAAAILRFCSDEYCFQKDTMLWNYQTKYIKTVAPNPLKIPFEAEILYQVEDDVSVTMRIIDQANRYVKTIIKNEYRRGGFDYCERWDGRLDDRTPAANGMYYIMLEFSNGVKEIYPIYIRN